MTADKGSLRLVNERFEAAQKISAELGNFAQLKPTLVKVMKEVQRISGCEAIGIRLYDGQGDYPYYVWDGFTKDFVKKENSLLARDRDGCMIVSPDGEHYELECMCGNVICSRVDRDKPFFTEKGSFWSNNTSALLASTSKEELGKTRNHCNSCGYESVALIPIANRSGRVGLIQLNDKRIGGFTRELIEFIEMLADHIGLAVAAHQLSEELELAQSELAALKRDGVGLEQATK